MGGVAETADTETTEKPWYVEQPGLLADVRAAIAGYPTLHLFLSDPNAEIRGTFPVRDESGGTLDEYVVSIELRAGYPKTLPVVRETAGRIPHTLDRHVVRPHGTCCVLLPDARWEEWPVEAPFSDYLAGPLRNFFLGQSIVEQGGEWPFGEWAHGNQARLDYYKALVQTESNIELRRYLEVIGWPHTRGRVSCPCGSGRRLRKCCHSKVHDLHSKLPRETARKAFAVLGFHRRGSRNAARRKRRR